MVSLSESRQVSQDDPHAPIPSSSQSWTSSLITYVLNLKDYGLGIILLLLVVLLWTLSNFVTQDLYQGGYNKPFLVTYLNTSAFSLYLIPYAIQRIWRKSDSPSSKASIAGSSHNYQPLPNNEDEYSEPLSSQDAHHHQDLPPLTVRETIKLAITFCLLWFIANWTVNASLEYTSVASATILTSTSGFFTLGIGRVFKVEKLNLLKFAAVCTSFFGVLLVSLSDSGSNQPAGPASHPKVHVSTVDTRATFGDILALVSALFYALYVILLKVRIKSESRVNMQLFFGFVGLFNILVCWPIGLVLHLTGVEKFELPSTRGAVYAILVNMVITLSSDYLYILAMLKTTPLVVTIGLSLTIPLAVIGDFLRGHSTHWQVLVGAVLVLLSFVAIGLRDQDSTENDDR